MRKTYHCPRCLSPLMAGEDHLKEGCVAALRDMIRKTTQEFDNLTATLEAATAEIGKLADAVDELAALDIPNLDGVHDG